MKINIATLFDKNYLIRSVAFYQALSKTGGDYTYWFLCLDDESEAMMKKLSLPSVNILREVDLADEELLLTRNNRTFAEFVFTCKSALMNFVISQLKDGEKMAFSDNDVVYFNSPSSLFEKMEIGSYSIGVVPHRFPKAQQFMNDKVGRFNAGLVYFIADQNSRECIAEWRRQCIEWCYLKYEKDRFGDQLYMNKWPDRFQGLYIIPDKGINVGSWSLPNFNLEEIDSKYFVDKEPLTCYHFHRIRFFLENDKAKPLPIYIFNSHLYAMYTDMINQALVAVRRIDPKWAFGFVQKPSILRLYKQQIHRYIRNLIRY